MGARFPRKKSAVVIGVIDVTTVAPSTTYIRTPTLQSDGSVTWATTGTCRADGLC